MNNKEHMRNYLWNYFQYHAGQRLTTFNFYIVISSLITSGYIIAFKDIPFLSLLLGFIIITLSFIFWKLDSRNKQLIKNSENGLKEIEKDDNLESNIDNVQILNIFMFEEQQTDSLRKTQAIWPWKRLFTYSTCLNSVFIIFAIIGLIGIIFSVITIWFPCLYIPRLAKG